MNIGTYLYIASICYFAKVGREVPPYTKYFQNIFWRVEGLCTLKKKKLFSDFLSVSYHILLFLLYFLLYLCLLTWKIGS